MTGLGNIPASVRVYEVGPRDGLQNVSETISTDVKVHFIDLLSGAGLPVIEVTSFVRPGAIPQLADAEAVAAAFIRTPGTRYTALVPNARGMERARSAGLNGIAVFAAASETFSRRNINASIDESLQRFVPVLREAREVGMATRGYVSTAFGCPYEGTVPVGAVLDVTERLFDLGVDEVSISDTIGVATPADVERVVSVVQTRADLSRIAMHFHDTRGTALANVLAAMEMGVATFDSSAGGLGGCPYAPGAAGNLATEDLVYMLDGMGVETRVSLDGVVAASRYLSQQLGRLPTSRVYAAVNA